jgi:hypothetical protein
MAYILDHGRACVLFTDAEFEPAVREALAIRAASKENCGPLLVVDICDSEAGMEFRGLRVGEWEYEELIEKRGPHGARPRALLRVAPPCVHRTCFWPVFFARSILFALAHPRSAHARAEIVLPKDEWDAIALSYTCPPARLPPPIRVPRL